MGTAAVLEKEDPLPGPERKPAIDHRDRDLHAGEGGPDVRGHVVRPFIVVTIARRVLGRGGLEPGSRSAHTSGEAFSWISSDAEVWRQKTVSRPVATDWASSQAAIAAVISTRPWPLVSTSSWWTACRILRDPNTLRVATVSATGERARGFPASLA